MHRISHIIGFNPSLLLSYLWSKHYDVLNMCYVHYCVLYSSRILSFTVHKVFKYRIEEEKGSAVLLLF